MPTGLLDQSSYVGIQDDLIFDIRELETLPQRIAATLEGVDPTTLSPDLSAGRLLLLLSRAGQASDVIQASIGQKLMAVISRSEPN